MYDGEMADPDEHAYGTAAPDAPATRAELERAVRNLHMSDLDLRDAMLRLAARVVALTDELTRRLDGVERCPPRPAPRRRRPARRSRTRPRPRSRTPSR